MAKPCNKNAILLFKFNSNYIAVRLNLPHANTPTHSRLKHKPQVKLKKQNSVLTNTTQRLPVILVGKTGQYKNASAHIRQKGTGPKWDGKKIIPLKQLEQKSASWDKIGNLLNYLCQIKTLKPSMTLSPVYLTLYVQSHLHTKRTLKICYS